MRRRADILVRSSGRAPRELRRFSFHSNLLRTGMPARRRWFMKVLHVIPSLSLKHGGPSVALPIKTPPSKKETTPTGAVAGVGVSATVAVSVAGVPSVAEVGTVRTVVVSSWATQMPVAA